MTPERGDILHLAFDPASGREMKGDHFCLVVSPRRFNAHFGLALVCPISQGAAAAGRSGGFLVTLMGAGTRTVGNVHVHQVKSLDWSARKARRVERVPAAVMDEVRSLLASVLEDE